MNSLPKPSPTIATLILSLLMSLFGKCEIGFRAGLDLLFLRAEPLMPSFEGVRAGRESFDSERAVSAGDRVVGVRQHVGVDAHPGMDVAHQHEAELGLRELRNLGRRLWSLGDIPRRIRFSHDIYLAIARIAVEDLDFLVDHQSAQGSLKQ